ncbi:hypothetical protein NMG60_11030326 [Bertholletia excelsa]
MATGWVKSLQCKSRALEDVVHRSHKQLLIPTASSGCTKNVKDVIETTGKRPRKESQRPARQAASGKTEPGYTRRTGSSTRLSHAPEQSFPALTELPEGHPSRNVVEIIFHSRWTPKAFSGRVELVFKVQNLPRTVTRFEEYREVVKSRAVAALGSGVGDDHARCVADGNEVMRFLSLGPTSSVSGYAAGCGSAWAERRRKGSMCTFSGSSEAHENAGGGKGRRAMLVCRVVAGRVCKQIRLESYLEGRVGYDSVSGDNGELVVFDSRAVLPCFLIIYYKL